MTWLDNAIGWVSPRAGLKRVRARAAMQLLEGQKRLYEGANIGRRNDGWMTSGSDANAEIGAANARMRMRAHDLVRNNAYASKAVASLTANVIGCGIVPRADDRTDELWARWSDTADAAGNTDFYGLQSLILRTMVESGSCLVRRRVRRPEDGLSVPLQLQVLEPDHLDTSRDVTLLTSGGSIEQGIEFDRIGRRVAYWLYPRHPGGISRIGRDAFESRRIPADEVLHIFDVMRPGQISGVTWFAPAIVKLRDLDEYDEFEMVRKKVAACLAALVTTDDDSLTLGPAELEKSNDEYRRLETLEPGMIEYLKPGQDIKFLEPPVTGGYGEYMRVQLHAIAAAVGLTYELLTGDLSQVNFSSARVGLLEFRRRVKQIQTQILLPQLLLPTWKWFVEVGQAAGALDMRRNRFGVKWTYPKFEAVEPLKDAMADLTRMRSGTLTLAEAQAAAGFDPADMLAEIAATNKTLDQLGIILDSDPRLVSKAGGLQGKAGPKPLAAGESDSEAEPADDDEAEERAMDMMLKGRGGVSSRMLNGHHR